MLSSSKNYFKSTILLILDERTKIDLKHSINEKKAKDFSNEETKYLFEELDFLGRKNFKKLYWRCKSDENFLKEVHNAFKTSFKEGNKSFLRKVVGYEKFKEVAFLELNEKINSKVFPKQYSEIIESYFISFDGKNENETFLNFFLRYLIIFSCYIFENSNEIEFDRIRIVSFVEDFLSKNKVFYEKFLILVNHFNREFSKFLLKQENFDSEILGRFITLTQCIENIIIKELLTHNQIIEKNLKLISEEFLNIFPEKIPENENLFFKFKKLKKEFFELTDLRTVRNLEKSKIQGFNSKFVLYLKKLHELRKKIEGYSFSSIVVGVLERLESWKEKFLKETEKFISIKEKNSFKQKYIEKVKAYEIKAKGIIFKIQRREAKFKEKQIVDMKKLFCGIKNRSMQIKKLFQITKEYESMMEKNKITAKENRVLRKELQKLESNLFKLQQEEESDSEEYDDDSETETKEKLVSDREIIELEKKIEEKRDIITASKSMISSNKKKMERWIERKNVLNYLIKLKEEKKRRKKKLSDFLKILDKKGIFESSRNLEDYYSLELIHTNRGEVYRGFLRGDVTKEEKCIKVFPYSKKTEKIVNEEIKKLINLNHPSIIKIETVFKFTDKNSKITKLGIQMKYIGQNLLEWVKGIENKKNVSYEELLLLPNKRSKNEIKSVLRKVMMGLEYLHSKDIEHRDIKPENIVISKTREVKIIDFEISKKSYLPTLTVFKNAGTERYQPPKGEAYSMKSDVFSLGITIFEILAKPEHVNLDPRHPEFLNQVEEMKNLENTEIELLKKMLTTNPTLQRLSSKECLQHDFFSFLEVEKQIFEDEKKNLKEVLEKFYSLVETLKRNNVSNVPTFHLVINRSEQEVEEKFTNLLSTINKFKDLLFETKIKFQHTDENRRIVDESGVDAGGLTREAYDLLMKELKDKKYIVPMNEKQSLFLPSDEKDLRTFFFNFGKLYSKFIVEKNTIGVNFGPLIFFKLFRKKIEGWENFKKVGYFYDEDTISFYVNQERKLEDFSFVKDCEESYKFTNPKSGKEELLCKENKREFYSSKISEFLFGNIYRKENINHFVQGFFSCLPNELIYFIITELDCISLERLGTGVVSVKREHLLNNITFSGNQTIDDFIKGFISSSTEQERRKFLSYVTGTETLSHDGILRCKGEEKKIRIRSSNKIFSHTCFYELEMTVGHFIDDEKSTGLEKFLGYFREYCLKNVHLQGQYDD